MNLLEVIFNPQPPKKPNWFSMRYHRWRKERINAKLKQEKATMLLHGEYVFFEIEGSEDLFISQENH